MVLLLTTTTPGPFTKIEAWEVKTGSFFSPCIKVSNLWSSCGSVSSAALSRCVRLTFEREQEKETL